VNKNILQIQKNIFKNLKSKALSYEYENSHDLKKYILNSKKLCKRRIYKSSYQELISKLKTSKIVYLGDFHAFDQNSRNLERITKYLLNKNNITIGMEFIHHKYQLIVNHYLEGKISEREFIENIDYKNSWRFPWKKYQYFFELAKQKKISILALNSSGTLPERDKVASQIITSYLKIYPKQKFLIMFGELHLMPNKLPADVEEILKIKIDTTIIHQNLDEVYWKSKPWQGNDKQIVKFNSNEFVIQTSAPWIKYESLLYWYENLDDDPEFDLHEYIIETGKTTLNSNSYENFKYLIDKVAESFQINFENLNNDFQIYDHFNLDLILKHIKKIKSNGIKNLFLGLVQSNNFFFLPGTNIFYCPNYSINRLSYLAGIKLFIDVNPTFSKLLNQNSSINFFIYYLHINFFAYIASKIINPYRKTDMAIDINNKIDKKEYLLASQFYKVKSIDELQILVKGKSKTLIFQATRIFSFSVAEFIFEKIYNQKVNKYLKYLNFKIDENQFLEVSIINEIISKKEIHSKRKRYF